MSSQLSFVPTAGAGKNGTGNGDAAGLDFSNLSVIKTFENRNVFLTGATGFVGKVILEKILRSIPNVGRIYVLVRPRKNQNPQDRMKEEILGSRIFTTLRSQRKDFDAWALSKLVAVPGELTQPKVGMSDEVRQMLIENVNIVIHCAAVVDFNERLDRALELNTLGSLRMLELAHECKHVKAFVHVSTCYVNSNQPSNSWIDEKVYPLGFDPEALIEKVMKMPTSDLDSILSTGILRNWPNTYTFTKAMTEHLLLKNRGNLPLAIVRPSIVGCAASEPVPGWVDVVSAAGAVFVAVGMGVVKFLPGSPLNIGDVIPVDYVSNSILVAISAIYDQDRYLVFQAASSSEHPLVWGNAVRVIKTFFSRYPPPRAVGPVSFRFLRSPQMYQIAFFLQYSVPSTILNTLALTGAPGFAEKAQLFNKLLWQVRVIIEAFRHFVQNQWIFSNQNVRSAWQSLSPEERKIFDLDLRPIDWVRYSELFAYGLTNYTLKAPKQLSLAEGRDLRHINVARELPLTPTTPLTARIFPDSDMIANTLSERLAKKMYPPAPTIQQLMEEVLNSKEVIAAIDAEAQSLSKAQSKKNAALTPQQMAQARAQSIARNMFGQTDDRVIGSLGLVLRKVWRRIYTGLHVALDNLNEVKAAAAKGPVIYIPTHRSYMDFLIVSYVALLLHLPMPFIAAGEDFLGIFFVRWLFRNSGAFFIRRSFANDKLYTVILQKYVESLLSRGQSIEFFIEGTRSRTGKMLQPKMGFVTMLTNAVQRGVVDDLTIVPITINYEKTMESHMYANELSGQRKIKESLTALVRGARSVINANFGRTTVVFSKPFSVKEWTNEHLKQMTATNGYDRVVGSLLAERKLVQQAATPAPLAPLALEPPVPAGEEKTVYDPVNNPGHRRYMNKTLACNIVYDLSRGLEVMPAQIVATLLLQYRQGITRSQLVTKFAWLRQEIEARGGYVFGVEMESVDAVVDDSLALLKDVLNMSHSSVYQPAIASRQEYNNMLVLGQYKNRLVDMFYREALWCVVLYSLSRRNSSSTAGEERKQSTSSTAVSIHQALAEVQFLHTMLKSDFVLKPNPDEPEDHMLTLKYMLDRGVLQMAGEDKVEVAPTGETHFSFLCALLWPFIDSFYTVTLMLYSLQPSRSMRRDQLVTQAQWLGTTLYHESMLCFFEASSKETLDNACSVLKNLGILVPSATSEKPKRGDPQGVSSAESVELAPYYQNEVTLETLVERLSALRKQPLISKSMSRKTLIADIPILAKLSSDSKL